MRSVLVLSSVAALSLAGSACSPAAPAVDLAGAQQAALAATVPLQTYCAAAAAMTSQAGCQAAAEAYGPAMSAALDRMRSGAPAMDGDLAMAGMPSSADMTCVMGLMTQELQAHLAAACTLADLPADAAEAARHCAAMGMDLDHQLMRTAELGQMMDGGGMRDGGMGTGGMMGEGGLTPDGGWTMPDGGTMSWDHAVPGCPAPVR